MSAAAAAAPLSVRVRMYRASDPGTQVGMLGDCFLVVAERGDERETVLIDCGMLRGSPDTAARMAAIAADVVEQAGGSVADGRPGRLDLLVVTHQHWDHLSGFAQARDVLLDPARLRIGALWLAWTEDGSRNDVKELRRRFDRDGAAFAAIAERLRGDARFGADAADLAFGGLDGFLGLAGKDGRLSTADILDELKAVAGSVTFLEPGQVPETPGAVGLRAYVLGPPTDQDKLFKDRPSAGPAQETYLDSPEVDGAQLLRFSGGTDPDPTSDSPFARNYCRLGAESLAASAEQGPLPEGDAREWLRRRYYGVADQDPAIRAACRRRRIDADWLGGAGPLALKLDSDTNNTSLVLAFELPDGDVMLFPGDAQVGNWLSWHDRDYPGPDGGRVTAEQLLNRTRFYKVGHHGSHNATLDVKGLAMMTHPGLVAAIPTDEELGKRQGRSGWLMPNPRVKAALRERTGGRILRGDRRYDDASRSRDPELRDAEPAFLDRLTETDLYLEYRVL